MSDKYTPPTPPTDEEAQFALKYDQNNNLIGGSVDPQLDAQMAGASHIQAPFWARARQFGNEVGPEAALSAVLSGGQYAAMAVPNKYDRENKAELERLRGLQAAGRLGLDDQEQQILERQQLDPVRAMAGEGQLRDEAMMASMGNQSAAMQNAAMERGRAAVAEQARRAGLNIAEADLARKRQQEREIQERVAYQAQKQDQRREFLSQALAGIAEPLGTAMAGRSVQELDMRALVDAYGNETAWAIASEVIAGRMAPTAANQMAVDTIKTAGDAGPPASGD